MKQSIVIADDHPLLLNGLYTFLTQLNYRVVGQATDGQEAYNLIVNEKPEIAVLDIKMPTLSGMEIAKLCKNAQLSTRIIFVTFYNEMGLYNQAVELGASGYILKEFALQELEKCLKIVGDGGAYVSPEIEKNLRQLTAPIELQDLSMSEMKILRLVCKELSSQQIADHLFLSLKTVEKHRSNIIKKLGLRSRSNSLTTWAIKNKKMLSL